jgi:hypothetical protein
MLTEGLTKSLEEGISQLESSRDTDLKLSSTSSITAVTSIQSSNTKASSSSSLGKQTSDIIESNITTVRADEHPKLSKFFRMKKAGISITAVQNKMTAEGLDCSLINKDPFEMIPINLTPDNLVAVSEHPIYSKYFKMLKIGLSKDAVKAKMIQENVNPDYLDKNPSELVDKLQKNHNVIETTAPVSIKKQVVYSYDYFVSTF